jgi:hypothetical protein
VSLSSKATIPGDGTDAVPAIPTVTLVVAPGIGIVLPLGMLMVTLGRPALVLAAKNRTAAAATAVANRRRRRRPTLLEPMLQRISLRIVRISW